MEKSLAEQEWEIKDAIRRAKGSIDRTSAVRRDTLRRLIDLTHSPHPTLKILAAGSIKFFFTDFPEFEEAAINAVYDLCEDPSPKVRIEGYTAITQVSTVSKKWIKRNADVLLQLLQSDEPDEVTVVKKALIEHLEMDPRITLGVLCDQIVPPQEPTDEEEQATRDRLRSLVLAFLTGEAKRAIIERHALPGSEAESVLVQGLLGAIPKLPYVDAELITEDLLVSLPSYKRHSQPGSQLLGVLLGQATIHLRADLRTGKPATLETTQMYLSLAKHVAVDKRIAPPEELLQFYFGSLVGKMTLQQLSPNTQVSIICDTAEILSICDKEANMRDASQVQLLRRQIVDACPYLLEVLEKFGLPNQRASDACVILLRLCKRRKEDMGWSIPPNLATAILGLQRRAQATNQEVLQDLIRSLAPSINHSLTLQPQDQAKPTSTRADSALSPKGVDKGIDLSLPERPQHSFEPARRLMLVSRQRSRDQSFTMAEAPPLMDGKHTTLREESPRPQKRRKDSEADNDKPSLLSRLGSTAQRAPGPTPPRSPPPSRSDSSVGFTIKGAAAKEMNNNLPPTDYNDTEVSTSLLQRLDGGSSNQVMERYGQWRGRKRGKPS